MRSIRLQQIILLHLLPGVPVLFLALLFSSPIIGLPFILSLFLAIALGLVPGQLLILLAVAKRQKTTIKKLIAYTERTPAVPLILWVLLLLSVNGLAFAFIAPLEQPLWGFFSWIPDWARISIEAIKAQPGIVWPTILLGFLMNGILGPVVEEIYFRGFLLPRMYSLGKAAPLVNTVLFSLYHLFSPWEFFTRIAAVLPFVYVVWYKKDIRIGIFVHCLGNLLGFIGTVAAILS